MPRDEYKVRKSLQEFVPEWKFILTLSTVIGYLNSDFTSGIIRNFLSLYVGRSTNYYSDLIQAALLLRAHRNIFLVMFRGYYLATGV